jgi:hypothetical protein
MLRCVDLVRTDFSEERIASNIRVTRFGELGTSVAVTSNRSTLMRNLSLRVLRLLLTANILPIWPILVAHMM